MVSKTDDIPASVPDCNPVDLADEAGDGAQDSKEISKTGLKDSCDSGENLEAVVATTAFEARFLSYFKGQARFCKLRECCCHFSAL